MRALSANASAMLSRDHIQSFLAVNIVTIAETFKFTSAPYDIDIPTLGIFSANSGLYSAEPPRLTSAVDRESYKINIVDPTLEFRSVLEDTLTGSPVTVYGGFFNTSSGTLSGIPAGSPFLTMYSELEGDLFVAYKGVIDTHSLVTNVDNGTVIITLECSSPVACLSLVRSFYTSKESLRERDLNDTAFDQSYAGSKQVQYVWGKE